jgi:hypothetical protein
MVDKMLSDYFWPAAQLIGSGINRPNFKAGGAA